MASTGDTGLSVNGWAMGDFEDFEMGDWGHGGLSELLIGEMPNATGVVQKQMQFIPQPCYQNQLDH